MKIHHRKHIRRGGYIKISRRGLIPMNEANALMRGTASTIHNNVVNPAKKAIQPIVQGGHVVKHERVKPLRFKF